MVEEVGLVIIVVVVVAVVVVVVVVVVVLFRACRIFVPCQLSKEKLDPDSQVPNRNGTEGKESSMFVCMV